MVEKEEVNLNPILALYQIIPAGILLHAQEKGNGTFLKLGNVEHFTNSV
jgi:hypothetical protein